MQKIAKHNKVILDIFTKLYSLLNITDFDDIEGLVVSYQNLDISPVVSADLLFGAIQADIEASKRGVIFPLKE